MLFVNKLLLVLKMNLKYYHFLYLLFFSTLLFSQSNNPKEKNNYVFQAGENLDYVITYSWMLGWTDVGAVKFDVKSDRILGKDVLRLRGSGITFSFYDWFYKGRDVYTSWVDPVTLLPVYFHRDVNEDGYIIDHKHTYDFNKKIAYLESKTSRKPLRYDTIPIPNRTYDVISVIYQARNIDFSKYKKDERIPFQILLDGEIHNVYIRFKGKEVKKVRGVGKFNTIKFTGSLVAGDVFKGGEDLTIWVSDDQNRIPVWIESPIIVGTIKARLVKYDGLKYPLKSLIDK